MASATGVRYGRLVGFTLSVIFVAANAFATTYYVGPGGSAANCTQAQSSGTPYAHVKDGVACATTAGDIVIIQAGTYTATTDRIDSQDYTVASGSSTGFSAGVSATWTGAITIKAQTANTVTLKPPAGKECIRFSTNIVAYVLVQDIICDKSNETVFGGSAASGVALSAGSNHNRFINIEVKQSTGDGVGFSHNNGGSPNNEWFGGKVHNLGDASGANPNNGYAFYISSDHNLIDGAEVYGSCGYGVHNYTGGADDAHDNTYRNMRLHNNGCGGGTNFAITIGDGANNYVYNNLVYNNTGSGASGGIRVYSDCTTCVVAFNTVYGNNANGIELQYYISAIVRDNIVYSNGATAICDYGGGGTCSSGTATIDHNLITDPHFSDPVAPDFSLTSSSTGAIDQGVTTGVTFVTTDILGNSRSSGSAPDIGAYEFVTSTVTITTTTLGGGQRTSAYSDTIIATGGTGTYTACSVTVGSLPTGLSAAISANTCVVSGTPSAANTFTFTIQMCDNAGSPVCDTQAFSVVISDVDAACSSTASGSWTLLACPGASSSNGTANAVTTAVDLSASSADSAFCGIAYDNSLGNPTMSDSGSNTWTLVGSRQTGRYGTMQFYYSRLTTLQASHTFTANTSSQLMYPAIQCVVFRGSRSSPLDATAGLSALGGITISPGSMSISKTNELTVMVAELENVDTLTADSGYTVYQRPIQSGKAFGIALQWKTYTLTGPVNPMLSWSVSMDAAAVGGTFIASDSSAPWLPHRQRLRTR